jgi:hypothetical protein
MSDLSITPASAPLGRQWDRVMIYAVFAAGFAAAIRVAPVFWFTTGLVVIVLLKAYWGGTVAGTVTTVVTKVDVPLGRFPLPVNSVVQAAVAQLPAGDARTLLGAVIRQARPLFGAATSAFDASKDNESRAHAADLVIASCDTAVELARLDALIESESRAGEKAGAPGALAQRYAAARAQFAKRLTDAASALGELYASGIEHGTPASDRVAELAAELKLDAASRAAAKVEVDSLLK